MPSDASNNKRPRNEQDLVETLGNPTASEAEWLHASEHLGEYKPKATATEARTQRTKVLGEVSILVAVGLGIWGLITFTQPSNMTPKPAPPTAAQAPTADVDFGPYMANLQRSIKRNWFPPKGEESKRVVCIFKISKDGELSKLRIDRSSGNAVADQAALKAIQNASDGFHSLPAGSPSDVDIQFTFDYNVFNKAKGIQHDNVDGEGGDSFTSTASN
jgi:TonB family protein